MTGETLDATRSFVTAVDHYVPDFKNGYLELTLVPAGKVQKAQRESCSTNRYLFEQKQKIRWPELRVRLLIDDSVTVSELRKRLSTQKKRIAILDHFP